MSALSTASSTGNEDDRDTSGYRKRWRSIIFLLAAIRGIQGPPTLGEACYNEEEIPADKEHKELRRFATAIVTLLVRNREVVASVITSLKFAPEYFNYDYRLTIHMDDPLAPSDNETLVAEDEDDQNGQGLISDSSMVQAYHKVANIIAFPIALVQNIRWPAGQITPVAPKMPPPLSEAWISAIQQKSWGCLDIKKIDSADNFNTHLYTIILHLIQRQQLLAKQNFKLAQKEYFHFQQYILRATLKKTTARINHRTSLAFLFALGNLCSDSKLFPDWYDNWSKNSPQSKVRHDRALVNRMQKIDLTGDKLEKWLNGAVSLFLSSDTKEDKEFKLRQVRELLNDHIDSKNRGKFALDRYRPETAFAVHFFLLGVLCDYWLTLIKFANDLDEESGNYLLATTNLLWQITESRLFHYHFDMLAYNSKPKFPKLPDDADNLIQLLAARRQNTVWSRVYDTLKPKDVILKSEVKDEELEDSLDHMGTDADVDLENLPDSMGGDSDWPEESVAEGRPHDTTHHGLSGEFRRWIRLQSSPLEALGVLSSFRWPHRVHVSTAPKEHPPSKEVENWEDTIYNINQGGAATMIKDIKKAFTDPELAPKGNDLALGSTARLFRKIVLNKARMTWNFPIHCEAFLACLPHVQADSNINDSDDSSHIVVSKRCCPVCWEFLYTIDPSTRFHARSSHTSLFPVDLPLATPKWVFRSMCNVFEHHLLGAITELQTRMRVSDRGDSHKTTPSIESITSMMSRGSDATAPESPEDSSIKTPMADNSDNPNSS